MGVLVLLGIVVVGIIVIVNVVKKNKKKKAIEYLKNSTTYEIALKIKEELEKKGYKTGEPTFDLTYSTNYVDYPYGNFICKAGNPEKNSFFISFSNYTMGLGSKIESFRSLKLMKGNLWGIVNENIGIFVEQYPYPVLEVFQGTPEVIRIADEVMKNNGYGESKRIDESNEEMEQTEGDDDE
jgi:hypothetical protein